MVKKYKMTIEFEVEEDENGLTDFDVVPNDDVKWFLKNQCPMFSEVNITSLEVEKQKEVDQKWRNQ